MLHTACRLHDASSGPFGSWRVTARPKIEVALVDYEELDIPELTELALDTGAKVGVVSVNMRDTACKVPDISAYVGKVRARGTIGKKRKTVKC